MEDKAHIHIKISPELHARLKAIATKEYRSMTAIVIMLIEEYTNKKKGEKTK